MNADVAENSFEGPPRPLVLLWHEGGVVEDHVDMMCATDPAGTDPLQTWRIPIRIDMMTEGDSTEVIELGRHRSEYLRYEGLVSGGRGSVTRIASGRFWSGDSIVAEETITIEWMTGSAAGTTQKVRLEKSGSDAWMLHCTARNP